MTPKILYTAKAKTTGGRDGHSETDDGAVKLDLSLPKSLGGPGKPEVAHHSPIDSSLHRLELVDDLQRAWFRCSRERACGDSRAQGIHRILALP